MQALMSCRKYFLRGIWMMQSLIFGVCIITSAHYSLWKWDHLQTNRLFIRSNLLEL